MAGDDYFAGNSDEKQKLEREVEDLAGMGEEISEQMIKELNAAVSENEKVKESLARAESLEEHIPRVTKSIAEFMEADEVRDAEAKLGELEKTTSGLKEALNTARTEVKRELEELEALSSYEKKLEKAEKEIEAIEKKIERVS